MGLWDQFIKLIDELNPFTEETSDQDVDAVAEMTPGIVQGISLSDVMSPQKVQAVVETITYGPQPPLEIPDFNLQNQFRARVIIGGYREVEATAVESRLSADHRYDGLSLDRTETLGKYDLAENNYDKLYYGTKFIGQGWAERIGTYRDKLQNDMIAQGIPGDLAQDGADFMTGQLLGAGLLSGLRSGRNIANLGKIGAQGSSKAGSLLIEEGGKFSQSEIRAVEYMRDLGNEVKLRNPVGTRAGGETSDLLVNGVNYDVYTPITNNPDRIISAIAAKKDQAAGIVLDISKTTVTPEQLGNIMERLAGKGVTSIKDIVILK